MMGHREKLDGDGYDAFARHWRRNLAFRPGEIAGIKRRYSKKARKTARIAARREASVARI